jgi:hypothetical protein
MTALTRFPTRLLVVAAATFSLIALVSWVSKASPQGRALQHATKAFHATKDCSGDPGHAGFFCTFKSSNVKAIKPGSKIFYFQAAGKSALNADTVLYAGRGNVAAGHCLLQFKTGRGLCTLSDGTGTLTGFHARVRVSADKTIANLWHWDGTYSFNR